MKERDDEIVHLVAAVLEEILPLMVKEQVEKQTGPLREAIFGDDVPELRSMNPGVLQMLRDLLQRSQSTDRWIKVLTAVVTIVGPLMLLIVSAWLGVSP